MSEIPRHALRKALALLLPTSSDFHAFVLDYFASVYRQFSSGMSRIECENELLARVAPEQLFSALERVADPRQRLQLRALVQASDEQPRQAGVASRPSLLFLEHAPIDQGLARELLQHLHFLSLRSGLTIFDPSQIPIGEPVHEVRTQKLTEATIILVLISSTLLAQDGFLDGFLKQAMQRQRDGAVLIPIIGRPTLWQDTPLGRLQVLPANGRPLVTLSRADREQAFADIARAIANVVNPPASAMPRTGPALPTGPEADRRPIPLRDIFPIRPGQYPLHNLVTLPQLVEIKDHLAGHPGLGLIVEGPSGIGKTTAVRWALDELGKELGSKPHQEWIEGRDPGRQAHLQTLCQDYRALRGHLIIDDFHRLPPALKAQVADVIKLLSTAREPQAKVTVIGVNPIARSLLRTSPDLASCYASISLGRQPDTQVSKLIERGESVANLRFQDKAEIIRQADGVLLIAQQLCFHLADLAGQRMSCLEPTALLIPTTTALGVAKLREEFDHVFGELLQHFAAQRCRGAERPRGATLGLLWLLRSSHKEQRDLSEVQRNPSMSDTTSLSDVAARYPALSEDCAWLGQSNLHARFESEPRLHELFHYDRDSGRISMEDPKLAFYLAHLSWPALIRDSGHDTQEVTWSEEGGLYFQHQVRAAERPPQVELKLPSSYILHLSDLHFVESGQINTFLQTLEADLQDLKAEIPRLDGIVVSGDLTQRATAAEFAQAAEFLRELRSILKLPRQQLVLVPGNHDGSWDVSREAYPENTRDRPGKEVREQPNTQRYRERFQSFADCYAEVTGQPYSLDFDRQAILHEFPEQKLLFLGLNSAWQCDHLQMHRGRAAIHAEALSRALRTLQGEATYRDWLKVAVFHHPVQSDGEDRIKNSGFLDRLAQAGFRLALHGHVHAPQFGLHPYEIVVEGRKVQVIGAGTFGAPTKEWRSGVPLQYQILCFAGPTLTVRSRCRPNPEGPWQADGRFRHGTEARSYYTIEL
ncbi:MAG TPA: metallophosphoesterase [Pseudomonadota bacterium]|nr:metallophosphoesterase [Pseudomonadota bacterium]